MDRLNLTAIANIAFKQINFNIDVKLDNSAEIVQARGVSVLSWQEISSKRDENNIVFSDVEIQGFIHSLSFDNYAGLFRYGLISGKNQVKPFELHCTSQSLDVIFKNISITDIYAVYKFGNNITADGVNWTSDKIEMKLHSYCDVA